MCLYSLSQNCDPSLNYDIIILYSDLGNDCIKKLRQSIVDRPTISLRFFDVKEKCSFVSKEQLFTCRHITKTAYYRLFLGSILSKYEKILYLDCDLIILQDLSELYNTELGNNACAAVIDYGVSQIDAFRTDHEEVKRYLKDVLGITDVKTYFNSGVMLLNLKKIRDENIEKKLMEAAKRNNKYWHDQNVLNSVFKNNCVLLDYRWNYLWSAPGNKDYGKTDYNERQKYDLARKNPMIIHYATSTKPFTNNTWEWGKQFWDYALKTPFKDELFDKIFTSLKQEYDARIESIRNDNNRIIEEKRRIEENNAALQEEIESIRNDNNRIIEEKRRIEENNAALQEENNIIKNSLSFKIGMSITIIPRFIGNNLKKINGKN